MCVNIIENTAAHILLYKMCHMINLLEFNEKSITLKLVYFYLYNKKNL